MILITQLIYIIDGQEKNFDEFENIAIPTILKYNGRLLLRVRPTDDNFLKDEERKKFFYLKEQSIKEAILIQGTKL